MTGRQGQTTLFYAAETGRIEAVRYLLEHGARVEVADDMGRTPIDVARGEATSKEIGTLLQSADAKQN